MKPDALVIGGGLAGAAAALGLASAGRSVVLIERERGPADKVCGEFMSVESIGFLEALGLDLPALGARPLRAVRLFAGGRRAEADLPFPAASLSRRRLDAALLDRAAEAGAEVRTGLAVRRLEDATAWLSDGTAVSAPAVLLATGKHDLRGWRRRPPGDGNRVGIKRHLRLGPAAADRLGDAVEVHLFPGGYAGLLPLADGTANLCLAVDPARLRTAGGAEALIAGVAAECPELGRRLERARPTAARPLTVAQVPYGYRAFRAPPGPDWLWRLGDQAAVTPSFTGDGMAIALGSALLAAGRLAAGGRPEDYLADLAASAGGQMRRAGLIDRLLAMPPLAELVVGVGALAPGLIRRAASATRIGGAAAGTALEGRPG